MSDEDLLIKLPPPSARPNFEVNWITLVALIVSIGSAVFSGLQWYDNRQTNKLIQGPYIEITKAELENESNIKLTFHNIGRAPAMNPQCQSAVYVSTNLLSESYMKLTGWLGDGGIMFFPSVPTTKEGEVYVHFPDVATFKKILKQPSQKLIEIRGTISYQDTFQNDFSTPYCYQLHLPNSGLPVLSLTCFSKGAGKAFRGYKR